MHNKLIGTLILFVLVLGMVSADPIRLSVIRTDKTTYESHETIKITAVNAGPNSSINVTDPDGINTLLGKCIQNCDYSYRPRFVKPGEYKAVLYDDTTKITTKYTVIAPARKSNPNDLLDFRTDQTSYVLGETINFLRIPQGTQIDLVVTTPQGTEIELHEDKFTPQETGAYTINGILQFQSQKLRVSSKVYVRSPKIVETNLGFRDLENRIQVYITTESLQGVLFTVKTPEDIIMKLSGRREGGETRAEFAYQGPGTYTISETASGKTIQIQLEKDDQTNSKPVITVNATGNHTSVPNNSQIQPVENSKNFSKNYTNTSPHNTTLTDFKNNTIKINITGSTAKFLVPQKGQKEQPFEVITPDGITIRVPSELVDEGVQAEFVSYKNGQYTVRQNETNITANFTLNLSLNTFAPRVLGRSGEAKQVRIKVEDKDGTIISDMKRGFDAIPTGKHVVELEPVSSKIKKLRLKEVDSKANFKLNIDTFEKKEFTSSYAIDPSGISFDSGTITAVAEDHSLFKCADWDFNSASCNGGWRKIGDITPGQEYFVKLTPDDPGFGEGLATVNTNKSTYHPNETAGVYITVLDSNGYLVKDASVSLNITNPSGAINSFSTTLGNIVELQRGIYFAVYNHTQKEGIYALSITTSSYDGTSSMQSNFLVDDYFEFDIMRETPLTTDPWKGQYDNTIKIISYSSQKFSFTESIPKSFNVTEFSGSQIVESNGRKLLTWNNLTNGSSISYSVQPPLITPLMYEIGPATVQYAGTEYNESRPWLLAVDPAGTTIPAFLNSNFEQNNFNNWTWSMNSFVNNGENCQGGEYATDGDYIVSATVGDWELIEGSYTGGGGEQEDILDGGDDLGNGYQGMLTSSKFTITSYIQNISFWIHSDYRSADNNQCHNSGDGDIFGGTANQTANSYGEGCFFGVWQETGATGRTGDTLVWLRYAARYSASPECTSGGNPFCNVQKVLFDVSSYQGQELYITGECIGRGNVDDSLFQLDGLKVVYNDIAPSVNNVTATPAIGIYNQTVTITANVTNDERTVLAMVSYANGTYENITMTDADSDDVYDCTIANITDIGTHTVTIWTDNAADNINNSETVTIDILGATLNTTQEVYLVDNIVLITGNNYRPNKQVTIEILNGTGGMVQGYPLNITSNADNTINHSWAVPSYVDEGLHTINAYDAQISKVGNSTSVTIIEPKTYSDQQSYARSDIASFVGEGMGNSTNVTVTIFSPSLDPVSGYPRTIKSNITGRINFTWNVPSDAVLGEYLLNITEENHTNRSAQYTFGVASAVVQTNDTSFKYGETVGIIGYNWDSNQNVTLTIFNPLEQISFGPANYTANNSGEIDTQWEISCGSKSGSYLIDAFEQLNSSKFNNYTFAVESRTLLVTPDYSWYKRNDNATITVEGFPPLISTNVSIQFTNGTYVNTFPRSYSSNSTGGINFTWKVGDNQALAEYNTSAYFGTCFEWINSSSINVVMQNASTDNTAYSSGDTVFITGTYWNRLKNVTLDIRNSTGISAPGYPKNVTATTDGYINKTWTALPGTNTIESYVLYAWESNNKSVNITYNFSVTLTATLNTNKIIYTPDKNVDITGSFYTGFGDVKLWIELLSTGGTAPEYPKLVSALASGNINDTWNTSDYCAGEYTIYSEDQNFPFQLFSETNFTIAYFDSSKKSCFDEWGTDCAAGPPEAGTTTYFGCSNGLGNDESVINITVNSTSVAAFEQVEVVCEFDPYSSADEEYAYYYNGTGWRQIFAGNSPSGVNYQRTHIITLDNVSGTHIVRCIIDYDGEADNCADVGSWYDNDDISIEVTTEPPNCTLIEGTPPNVTSVNISSTTPTLNQTINISATIKDENAISSVIAVIDLYGGVQRNVTMLNIGNGVYKGNTSQLASIGGATITIWAVDEYSNTNNSENININVTFEELNLNTDKQSYVENETVMVVGGGFNPDTYITITLVNITSENQAGYPKSVLSNESGRINFTWRVPLSQKLGTYTFNATDSTNNTRSAETEIKIVLAVIEVNDSSYEVGEQLQYSGSNWDSNVNVSINITDSNGVGVYGPINITTNGSGEFVANWTIPWDEEFGIHNISAYQIDIPAKKDFSLFTIDPRTIYLETLKDFYFKEQTVQINGSNFRPTANITLSIYNATTVVGYPKNVTSLGTGVINDTWYIYPGDTLGTYNILAYDADYPTINKTINVRVTIPNVTTNQDAYNSGDTVTISGQDWEPFENVTIRITNSSGDTQAGYPSNQTADAYGQITDYWTALPGANSIEEYTVWAWESYNQTINSSHNYSVTLTATLNSDAIDYIRDTNVTLTGSFYTGDGSVSIGIVSLDNNGNAEGYPRFTQADVSGNILHLWNTQNYCPGPYRATSKDYTYPEQLLSQTDFNIVNKTLAFDNADFGYNNDTNWQWLGNRYSAANQCGESSGHAQFNIRGITVLNASNSTFFSPSGDWERGDDEPVGGGGSEEAVLTTSGTDDYSGMMMTQVFTVPNQANNLSFWAHGYYLSGENACTANRYSGTLSVVSNADRGEMIAFGVWVDGNGDTTGNTNIADDYLIYEVWESRVESGSSNFGLGPDTYSIDISNYRGEKVYLTGVVYGTGPSDDALIQMDNVQFVINDTNCAVFDITPPNVTNMLPSAGKSYNISDVVNITALIKDDRAIKIARVFIDMPNSTHLAHNMSDDDLDDSYNYTFNMTQMIGKYNVSFVANDTSSNSNDTESTWFWINDTKAPTWNLNKTSPKLPTNYSLGAQYQFNVTWTDNYALADIIIEHNFTGILTNYSPTGNNGDEYYYDYLDLSAGKYVWRMYANDTSGNINQTDQWEYNIQKIPARINLTVNEESNNLTVFVGSTVNITGDLLLGEGILKLYRNGSLINSGTAPLTNLTSFNVISTWNITLLYNDTQNYSYRNQTFYITTIDSGTPKVIDLAPLNATEFNVTDNINISANVTDDFAVENVTVNISWYGGQQILELTWNPATSLFELNFTNTSTPGRYNFTIIANDTVGNVNNSETGHFFVLEKTRVTTNYQSYIGNETVFITGSGFHPLVDVTVDIKNSSGSVAGYPKVVSANVTGGLNTTWTIPSDQKLGTYTVNGTDQTNITRTNTTTFSIVSAVIQTQYDSYEQGQVINFTGYNWGADINVTVNITDSLGNAVLGPKNYTTNTSGEFNATWFVPYDKELGIHNISSVSVINPNKKDSKTFTIEARPVNVSVELPWYWQGEIANVSGSGFSPDASVSVDVKNSTLESLSGYPKIIAANSSGYANKSIDLTGVAFGNYTASMKDVNFVNLNDSEGFLVVKQDVITDKTSYGNGETVFITGQYWERNINITIEVRNQTGDLLAGYPLNVTSDSDGDMNHSLIADAGILSSHNHSVRAYLHYDKNINSSAWYLALLEAVTNADDETYDQNETVNVQGTFFTPFGDINVTIENTNNETTADYYPNVITANSSGGFDFDYFTANICEDDFVIKFVDLTNPLELYSTVVFNVSHTNPNTTSESASSHEVQGTIDASGGNVASTATDDGSYQYFSGLDAGTTDAFINYTFDIGYLNVLPTLITEINISLQYCHSGNQAVPQCNTGGSPHEGTRVGEQTIEIFNFTSASWNKIGNITVNDTSDAEKNVEINLANGLSNYVNNGLIHVRYEMNFTRTGFDDDILVIDYQALNLSYDIEVNRSCDPFTNSSLSVPVSNSSQGSIDNALIKVYDTFGSEVDNSTGEYYSFLPFASSHDVSIEVPSNRGTIYATVHNLTITGQVSMPIQIISNYTGSPLPQMGNTTPMFYLNDSNVSFNYTEIALPTNGDNITYIMHCTDWSVSTAVCNNWNVNESEDYNTHFNGSHILFNVTSFDTFGGGAGSTMPNLTSIDVYNVTGLADTHNGGTLVGSGLEMNFTLAYNESYRIEANVRNDGQPWTITGTDIVEHRGLNASWNLSHTNDIWYTLDGNATNLTGGTSSSETVAWDTSNGGKLNNGDIGTFFYVFRANSTWTEDYPVYFLVNDTSKNVGSFDNSTYQLHLKPEIMVNQTSIQFNVTTPVEDDFVNVSIDIFNLWGGYAWNVTVTLQDNTTGELLGTRDVNISPYNNATLNFTWSADIGTHQMRVQADIPLLTNGDNEELNETNNEAFRNITVSSWHTYHGIVTGNITLRNSANQTVYNWQPNSIFGAVYLADGDSSVDWLSLQALGRSKGDLVNYQDFDEVDFAFNMTGFNDSMNRTFFRNEAPKETASLIVFGDNISNIAIDNSTNTDNFFTGVLWDTSDSVDAQYDQFEQEDLVFVTKINENHLGEYGTYDFEIKIPSGLATYKEGSDNVYFYGELR